MGKGHEDRCKGQASGEGVWRARVKHGCGGVGSGMRVRLM